jgi:hypothetical protein
MGRGRVKVGGALASVAFCIFGWSERVLRWKKERREKCIVQIGKHHVEVVGV